MNHGDYQARMLADWYSQVPRLTKENRKLKRIIALLLVAGTVQYLVCWF